jgi:hypothetical protein
MKRVFAVVVLGMLLASCGGGNGPDSQPPATLTSGNWTFYPPTVDSNQFFFFGGNLTQTGSTVSGVAYIGLPDCVSLMNGAPVTGSIRGNSLTLQTGTTVVVKITGTISNSKSVTGTYSVSGTCDDGAHGNITGTYIPPLTGTWNATEVINGASVAITLKLTQQETPSLEGYFPLSGTVEYVGSPCVVSATVNSQSLVLGGMVGIVVDTSEVDGGSGQLMYAGVLEDPATATSFNTVEQVMGGGCLSSGNLITFTKQ